MIKEAGFDFIRGSHYPHDPHFAETTDRLGMLFLSEAPVLGHRVHSRIPGVRRPIRPILPTGRRSKQASSNSSPR